MCVLNRKLSVHFLVAMFCLMPTGLFAQDQESNQRTILSMQLQNVDTSDDLGSNVLYSYKLQAAYFDYAAFEVKYADLGATYNFGQSGFYVLRGGRTAAVPVGFDGGYATPRDLVQPPSAFALRIPWGDDSEPLRQLAESHAQLRYAELQGEHGEAPAPSLRSVYAVLRLQHDCTWFGECEHAGGRQITRVLQPAVLTAKSISFSVPYTGDYDYTIELAYLDPLQFQVVSQRVAKGELRVGESGFATLSLNESTQQDVLSIESQMTEAMLAQYEKPEAPRIRLQSAAWQATPIFLVADFNASIGGGIVKDEASGVGASIITPARSEDKIILVEPSAVADGETIELRSTHEIAPLESVWNLRVLREPAPR